MRDINATVIVDLHGSEEEIMRNLHKDARWGINKARKEGLVVEEVREEEWKDFYEIYKKTMREGGSVPGNIDEIKNNSRVLFVCKKQGNTKGQPHHKVSRKVIMTSKSGKNPGMFS